MNQQEHKSLNANVSAFCKGLTDMQLKDLTDDMNYNCYNKGFKPNAVATKFIEEMFSKSVWDDNLSDEINKPEFFCKATRNDKELIRLVRIGLMQECFFRFMLLLNGTPYTPSKPIEVKPKEPKGLLSVMEKLNLTDILKEHYAMLEYQLEDEEGVYKVGGDELVNEKKKHRDFIEQFRIKHLKK